MSRTVLSVNVSAASWLLLAVCSGCAMTPMYPSAMLATAVPPAAPPVPQSPYPQSRANWNTQAPPAAPAEPMPNQYARARSAYDVMPAAFEEESRPSYLEHGPVLSGNELTRRTRTATETALELKNKLDDLELKHELEQNNNRTLKTRLEATEKDLATFRTENEELRQDYATAKQSMEGLKKDLAGVQAELGKLNEQVRADADRSLQEFDRLLDELQGSVLELALQQAGATPAPSGE